MILAIRCALILAILIFGTFDAMVKFCYRKIFEGDLDLTTKWQTGHPNLSIQRTESSI